MLELGQTFAHFKILEKLGEGGMGAVYLAEDQKLRRQVALKILSREYFEDEERKLRFEREARVAASINHPNIMAIHEIGEEPSPSGAPLGYIVMEYIQGQTLGAYLEESRPEMAGIVHLGERIAAGLAAAHKLGVVHRDIKPDNIIVSAEGNPKILDFGVAKPGQTILANDSGGGDGQTMTMADDLTQAGRIVGTVTYMSPEQAQGEPIDTRSDVFAFGILLYRMATGEFPFAGKTSVSVLAKIIEGQHIPPRKQNDEIAPELERILDKCLQKSPDDRYRDTEDLVKDLRELRRAYDGATSGVSQIDMAPHLTGLGVPSAQDPNSDPSGVAADSTGVLPADGSGIHSDISPGPGARPNNLRRLLLGAAGVALLALVFLVLRDSGGGSIADASESRLAILVFENKTGDTELDWLETGLPEILLTDLAQCQGLSLISRDRVTDILKTKSGDGAKASHQEWLAAARELGATTVLTGSFYKLGTRIRIDARLEDVATGKILLAEKAVGEDPFALVDDITLKVATSLHVVDPDAPESDVTTLTTKSTDAYKEYLLGQEKLFLGLLEESREHFDAAIEADSTFALAYMRMAMSYVFDGRSSQSATYFARAKDFEDKLLPSGRAILNIYNDIWANRDLSKAMSNMEQYVHTYPDDREGKTMYALLINSLQSDSTKSDAVFNEVLAEDPAYPLGLFLYAASLSERQRPDRAIEVMQTYQKYHPESPTSYSQLGGYYRRLGDSAKATASYEEFQRRFPSNLDVAGPLATLAIQDRDFAAARRHVLKLAADPNDHFRMVESYARQSDLDFWEGKFLKGLEKAELQLAEAKASGDSNLIFASLSLLSDFHREMGNSEKAVLYARDLEPYEEPTSILNRPLLAIKADLSLADEFRPIMRESVNTFKANIPQELWRLADSVQDLYDGYVDADTLKLTRALETLINRHGAAGDGNRLEVVSLFVHSGQEEKAVPHLERILKGAEATNSGRVYPQALYYSARCSEKAGDLEDAARKYTEMLSFWGDPDFELEIITDARARLARLSS